MLDLLLQQLDLVRCEIEQAIDPVVQFGLSVGEGAREACIVVTLLLQIRLPLVGEAGVLHGVRRELEALFQGVAKLVQREFPPRPGFLVQGTGVAAGEGLE